jgi:predicted amidophosphoribosyltransferase
MAKAKETTRFAFDPPAAGRLMSALDKSADELYDPRRTCPTCGQPVARVDELRARCPHCAGHLSPGRDTSPERAAVLLAELLERRRAMARQGPGARGS